MEFNVNKQTEESLKEVFIKNKDQMMARVAERIKKNRRHLFKTEAACEMASYMNLQDVYQSGRIYSHGIINLIKE